MSDAELVRIAELELQVELLRRTADEARKRADENHARYLEAARRYAEMMSLHVAAHRLHESNGRSEVLAAIQEIVINLIGSEELAVFELKENELRLIDSFGIEKAGWTSVPLGEGPLSDSIRAGHAYVAEGKSDDQLTACVPLMAGSKAVGLVAVFRLLPHKSELEKVDHELFDVLRAHGGNALFYTHLAAKEQA